MRTYFLLLVFAASAVAIVECDAGDNPNQVARRHRAPMYRRYSTRADAERGSRYNMTGGGLAEAGQIVSHTPGTAHFRCACGERLVFSAESRALKVLVNFQQEGGVKLGSCPQCGSIHATRNLRRAQLT